MDQLQRRISLAVLAATLLLLVIAPIKTIIGLNILFIAQCATVLGLRVVLLYLSATGSTEKKDKSPSLETSDLPVISVLCPLYDEVDGLPGLIDALTALAYPPEKLDIILILEADDERTISQAGRLELPSHFRTIMVPASEPRTKPKACNYALWQAKGALVVIYDAEDRPVPTQLRNAAEAFADVPPDVGCLQARLNYYNRSDTLLTRLFAIEYALLFDLILPGLERLGAPLPLGGTSNFFRTRQLQDMGGWDAFNVTEDADLGMRMARRGLRSMVINSTTYEEATANVLPWTRQRSRWIKGYIQTWLVHIRPKGDELPASKRNFQFYLTLHLLIGSVVIAAVLNPLYWSLYVAWLLGVSWIDPLFPSPLGAIATFTLLAGNLFHIWLFMLAPMRRQWHDLVPYALFAPLYWILQSVAGYIAFWQFLTRPFYWEKTHHSAGQQLDLTKLNEEAEAS